MSVDGKELANVDFPKANVSAAWLHNRHGISGRLPHELWGMVFIYCVQAKGGRSMMHLCQTLLSICRSWRTVAFGLPCLWTEIVYVYDPGSRRTALSYVKACLKYSKNSALEVHISYMHLANERFRGLVRLLMPHADRFKHIELYLSHDELGADLFPFPGQLPLLRSFSLEFDSRNTAWQELPQVICLLNGQGTHTRSLAIRTVSPQFQFNSVGFKDLKVLHLDCYISRETFTLLSDLPSLEELYLENCALLMASFEGTIILNSLRKVMISVPISWALLAALRTPQLRSVKLEIKDEDELASLAICLQRMVPPNLHSMDVSFVLPWNIRRRSVVDICRLLARPYNITSLTISMKILPRDLVCLLEAATAGHPRLKRLNLRIVRPAFFGERLDRVSKALDQTLTTCPGLTIKYVSSGFPPSVSPSNKDRIRSRRCLSW